MEKDQRLALAAISAGFLMITLDATSAACAVPNSIAFLIAARVAQGVGAAWLMACSLALIARTLSELHARRHALAVWGAVSGVSLASGPKECWASLCSAPCSPPVQQSRYVLRSC